MKESNIEEYFVKKIKAIGGQAKKFVSPGWRGVPDRIALFPNGFIVFVELKAPGEKPRKQQMLRIMELRALGFMAEYVDTKEAVDKLMRRIEVKRCQ